MYKYIRGRDKNKDGLSDTAIKQLRCLKHYSSDKVDTEAIPEQDVIGEFLLNNDPSSPTTMRNLTISLMANDLVNDVVHKATGNETCSLQHALAYFVGQLSGIELSESATDDVDPVDLSSSDRSRVSMRNVSDGRMFSRMYS